MQTREQVLSKLAEMVGDLATGIMDEAKRLLKCGAFDMESAEDNYRVPKIVLAVALENMARQYGPLTGDVPSREEFENLRRF